MSKTHLNLECHSEGGDEKRSQSSIYTPLVETSVTSVNDMATASRNKRIEENKYIYKGAFDNKDGRPNGKIHSLLIGCGLLNQIVAIAHQNPLFRKVHF